MRSKSLNAPLFGIFCVLLVWSSVGCTAHRSDRGAPDVAPQTGELDSTSPPQERSESGPGYLTIRFTPTKSCVGGRFYIDGEARGGFPVARFALAPSNYVLRFESRDDCASTGSVEIEILSGNELRIDLDQQRESTETPPESTKTHPSAVAASTQSPEKVGRIEIPVGTKSKVYIDGKLIRDGGLPNLRIPSSQGMRCSPVDGGVSHCTFSY